MTDNERLDILDMRLSIIELNQKMFFLERSLDELDEKIAKLKAEIENYE